MDNVKIGSRELSKVEANLILPTFDKIFTQIDEIRLSLSEKNSSTEEVENAIQKTNNIGILGPRGAGKTSLLKTIARRLKSSSESKNDIILPIVIPENMSASSTLMATILGLFKKEVEEIDKSKKKDVDRNCIREENAELRRKYSEVIKQYVFIQKEYRDILINEFTTENEYTKKSNEIFNSDIEFITRFNEFVEELVSCKGENVLIFFFIDDIDLSTSRCTDVIKTLLSYISHKNIVTFISGDLNTFEEALTIDFLRQEKALENRAWNGRFLSDRKTLLESKRDLAYEYLKKVVPPMYRHTIKRWSLEDRGNYVIDSANSLKLSELLIETLEGIVNPSLFKFTNYQNNARGVQENLHYTYHLFDDTSRGINNVYNVLSIINTRKKDNVEISFSDKKVLIETIAASKPVFNEFREQLFGNIISFGSDEKSTFIRFDNLKYMIDDGLGSSDKNIKSDKDSANNKNTRGINISNIKKFQLFVFVDFSAKLVGYKDIASQRGVSSYNEVKSYIINILVNNPEISDSSYRMKSKYILEEKSIDKNSTPLLVLNNFLLKSNWELALSFYKNLSMDSYEIISDSKKELNIREKYDILQNYAWKLYLSFSSDANMNKLSIQDYIANIYDPFTAEFAFIQDSLSVSEVKNTVRVIYKNIMIPRVQEDISEDGLKVLFNNFLYETVRNRVFDSNNRIKTLEKKEYIGLDEDEQSRLNLIYNIDKSNLWNHSIASKVKIYIEVRINTLIRKLFETKNISINIESFKEQSYKDFEKIYKGISYTIAKELEDFLSNNLINSEDIDFSKWSRAKEWIALLAYNNRVAYGQYEAQKMLNEFNTLVPTVKDEENCPIDTEELIRLLHYHAIYTIKENEMESVYLQSKQLYEFTKYIAASQGQVNTKMILDFMDSINDGIKDKISIEQFEELFN